MPYTVKTLITSGSYYQNRFLFFKDQDEITSLTFKQARKLYYHLAIHPSIFSQTELCPIRKENIPVFPLDPLTAVDNKELLSILLVDKEHDHLFHDLSNIFNFELLGFRM